MGSTTIGPVTGGKILRGASLALAALLLALGLAELGVRALGLGPASQILHRELFQLSTDPLLGYELHPLAPDGPGRINAAGFRGPEVEQAKAPGVFRIVAVGDSVTFGQPKKPDEAWPAALERALRARGLAAEVLNLGVTGYNVLQVAERLRTLGLRYRPDLVLYGYVLNDPQELSIELEALVDLRAAEEGRLRAELGRGLTGALVHSRLFLWLRGLRSAPALVPGSVDFRHPRDPAYEAFQHGDRRGAYFRALHEDPAGRERLGTGLDRMAEATRAAGVPLEVVLFPLLLDPRDGPYPLTDVHALVGAEARARGFAVLDLQTTFAGGARMAADFLHPNAAGAEAAARAILADLERTGRLPERTR